MIEFVGVYDVVPDASKKIAEKFSVRAFDSVEEIAKASDALNIVTEWNEFRNPDFNIVASSLKNKVIFDGRNIYDPEKMREHGVTYYGI